MTKEEMIESLKKLKTGYVASLNTLEVMHGWGRAQLEALYTTKIGVFKIQALELQIHLKALKKKIQLCQADINQDRKPDFKAIEESVNQMVDKAYQEVNMEKEKVVLGKSMLDHLSSPEDSADIRNLFRKFAKVLHPDVNPEMTAEQMGIWNQVYKAYKSGDLDRLRALEMIYAETLNQSEKSLEDFSEEELLVQTAKLKTAFTNLEKEIAALNKEFPFNLAEQIRDEEWVKEQQDLVKAEIAELEIAVKEKEEIYQLIRETYE